jgi:hypothetical protein
VNQWELTCCFVFPFQYKPKFWQVNAVLATSLMYVLCFVYSLSLKVEVTFSIEMLVDVWQVTSHHIPKVRNYHRTVLSLLIVEALSCKKCDAYMQKKKKEKKRKK